MPGASHAQEAAEPINFVFSALLGSGIYKDGDRAVQVYRIPGSYTLRAAAEPPCGIVLRFAGALGFYDFEVGDLLEGEIPNDVDTFTLLAGAEFPIPLNPHWELAPLADVGYGIAGSSDQSSWVFAVGAESRLSFRPEAWTLTLGNRLLWAGQSADSVALAERFVKFDTVFDTRATMPWSWGGQPTDLGPFVAVYLYASGSGFLGFPVVDPAQTADAPYGDSRAATYEIGFTHGTVDRWRIWKLPVPRVGLSYRFGEGASYVRLVLGAAF